MDEQRVNHVIDLLQQIKDEFLEQKKQGRSSIFVYVHKKYSDWLDKQVEAGTYKDHTHAIESLIREKMKE